MNLASLTDNQQVAAVIKFQIRPEETRTALARHPLFNLVAVTPTKLIVEERWFALDRDTRAAQDTRALIVEPNEVSKHFKAAKTADRLDEEALAAKQAAHIRRILESPAKGEIALNFTPDMSAPAVEAIIRERIPFLKLTSHILALRQTLAADKDGALLSISVSHAPLLN